MKDKGKDFDTLGELNPEDFISLSRDELELQDNCVWLTTFWLSSFGAFAFNWLWTTWLQDFFITKTLGFIRVADTLGLDFHILRYLLITIFDPRAHVA